MKRKGLGFISILVMMMLSLQSVAYAGMTWENKAQDISNVQEFSNDNAAKVVGVPRGQLMSSFEVELEDKGKGTLGVFGSILCHEAMRQIRMNLYLDIWNEEISDWETVDSFKFTWNTEDTPNEDLTVGIVSFDVPGMERGRDYRLRGFGGAYAFDGVSEAWRAYTGTVQAQSLE